MITKPRKKKRKRASNYESDILASKEDMEDLKDDNYNLVRDYAISFDRDYFSINIEDI